MYKEFLQHKIKQVLNSIQDREYEIGGLKEKLLAAEESLVSERAFLIELKENLQKL